MTIPINTSTSTQGLMALLRKPTKTSGFWRVGDGMSETVPGQDNGGIQTNVQPASGSPPPNWIPPTYVPPSPPVYVPPAPVPMPQPAPVYRPPPPAPVYNPPPAAIVPAPSPGGGPSGALAKLNLGKWTWPVLAGGSAVMLGVAWFAYKSHGK